MKKVNNTNLLFLSPHLTIANSHLSKSDVKKIKYSLLHKICFSSLMTGILLLLVSLVSFISMGISTNWNQVAEYGLFSLLGQIVAIVGTSCSLILCVFSIFTKNTKIKNNTAHIGNIVVFVTMLTYMFFSMYADVSQGFLSVTPTLSPAITLVSFFLIIQPVFWIEALILDGLVAVGLVVFPLYFSYQSGMQALMYYLLIAVFYPIVSYVIVSILFYAETQRYFEESRNEALHNTATYDELTRCKNRHALKEIIDEKNKVIEDGKEHGSLLVMMFDIDDFKLYNDQYSHIGGDYCLRAIADCVRNSFPSPTLNFYRYGGEEFLLILDVEDLSEAKKTIESVRLAVVALDITAAKGAPCEYVTISIGGTYSKLSQTNDLNNMIKTADEYLYKAKRSGKNVSVLNDKLINK